MIASTFIITAIGWYVTARIVEPRLGTYDDAEASEDLGERATMEPVSPVERRALGFAGLGALFVTLGVLVVAGPDVPVLRLLDGMPGWGVLRNPRFGRRRSRGVPPAAAQRRADHRDLLRDPRVPLRSRDRLDAQRPRRDRRDGQRDPQHGPLHRAGLLRGSVRLVLRLLGSRPDPRRARRGRPDRHAARQPAGLRSVHPDVLFREPDARLGGAPSGRSRRRSSFRC